MRLVGAGFNHREVLYNMSLFDIDLALKSLQWHNIELMQALRFQTTMTIAPYSKSEVLPEELYELASDNITSEDRVTDVASGLDRAKQRVMEFNRNKQAN